MANIQIEVDLDDLASELQYLSYGDIVRFVMTLDAYVADSDLTNELIATLREALQEES